MRDLNRTYRFISDLDALCVILSNRSAKERNTGK